MLDFVILFCYPIRIVSLPSREVWLTILPPNYVSTNPLKTLPRPHPHPAAPRPPSLRSMISSILNLPGVANPSSFQVLGKRRDGSHGGVVQVSVVQDEAFRPLHFTICVLDNTAGASAFVGGGRGGNPGIMMATPNLRTPDGAVVGGLS